MSQQNYPRYLYLPSLLLATAFILIITSVDVGAAGSAGGDLSINWSAAAPFSYTHSTGGGAFNDGTNNETGDIREELEGGDYSCGDTVTYLGKLTVVASPTNAVQTVQLATRFSMDSTGQSGAAHTAITNVAINYGQVENGDGGTGVNPGPGGFGLDSAIVDDRQTVATGDTGVNGSTISNVVITTDPPGALPFQGSSNDLVLTFEVDDLEAGEVLVLRIDTLVGCDPNSSPTGNLQARFSSGAVVEADGQVVDPPDTMPGGEQTINFKQVGRLGDPTAVSLSGIQAGSAGTSGWLVMVGALLMLMAVSTVIVLRGFARRPVPERSR